MWNIKASDKNISIEEKRKKFFIKKFFDKTNVPADLTALKARLDGLKEKPLYRFTTDENQEYIEPACQNRDSDSKLLKNIRHKYLHLSAKGGVVDSPSRNNKRLIIDDAK